MLGPGVKLGKCLLVRDAEPEPEPEPEPPKRFARSRSRSRRKRVGSGSEKGYNCGKITECYQRNNKQSNIQIAYIFHQYFLEQVQ